MRVAILGARGQLGTALQSCLRHELIAFGRDDVDITRADSVDAALQSARADFAINAAAYNWVDRAEAERDAAFAVNAFGAQNAARACARLRIPLVHVSTDYVFGADRERTAPYAERDAVGPLGVYGQSKLAGEDLVAAESPRNLVIRTCGLYGRALTEGKGNFVKTMLRLAKERPELKVVDDQRCTPSSAADVAAAIAELMEAGAHGLFHVTNAGDCSWHDFAVEIFRLAKWKVALTPISSSEYPTQAMRPHYSVLDTGRIASSIGRPMPAWQAGLEAYVADLL